MADVTAHSPLARIPKLKYRIPLPPDQASLSSQHSQDSGSAYTDSHSRPTTPDLNAASVLSRPSSDVASASPPSLASTTSSVASSNDSASSKKKKRGSMFGFLTLKEPSQIALEQFAEQQRRQATGKGSSPMLARPASVYASQKLPATVPKVNSKWDGVPGSVKNRYSTGSTSIKDKRSSASSKRSSLSSQGSLSAQPKTSWNDSRLTVMTDGTRNPPNSIVSSSPSPLRSSFAMEDDISVITHSPDTSTFPELASYSLYDHMASGASPRQSSEAHAAYATAVELSPRLSVSTYDGRSSIDASPVFRSDSPASSTDSVDTVVRDTADTIFRKLNDQPHQSFWGNDISSDRTLDEESVPDSHDFLFNDTHVVERSKNDSPMASSPISAMPIELPSSPSSVAYYAPTKPIHNFSRPMSMMDFRPSTNRTPTISAYRRPPSTSALPTLYEASFASSTESFNTVREDDGDTQSIAPSTIAPSEMSKHWYESPRERLGLGGRLKMNDVSPWDNQGETLGKPKKSRLSMFGIGAKT